MVDAIESRLDKIIAQAINTTNEGIVITDARLPNNPIVFVNKGFLSLTGYSQDEIVGNNCRLLQGENTSKQSLNKISDAIRTRRSCVVELLNYRKDGSEFWNRLSITPLFDDDGNITHFVGVQSDITELRRIQTDLIQANQQLETFFTNTIYEMEQARITQSTLLPAVLPESEFVRFASHFEPLEQIGGDFYDIVELGGHLYGLLLADATGHGIPAAMLTFMTSNTFKSQFPNVVSTAKVISGMNDILYKQMPGGMFVSLYYMVYNAKSHKLTYSQAGNPPAFLLSPKDNKVEILATKGTLVGIVPPDLVHFEQKEIVLNPGDKIVVFTDAILEANNKNGDLVELSELQQFLYSHLENSIDDIINIIYDYGLNYANSKHYLDDATLIGFQVNS